jgi:hypothetical protein
VQRQHASVLLGLVHQRLLPGVSLLQGQRRHVRRQLRLLQWFVHQRHLQQHGLRGVRLDLYHRLAVLLRLLCQRLVRHHPRLERLPHAG